MLLSHFLHAFKLSIVSHSELIKSESVVNLKSLTIALLNANTNISSEILNNVNHITIDNLILHYEKSKIIFKDAEIVNIENEYCISVKGPIELDFFKCEPCPVSTKGFKISIALDCKDESSDINLKVDCDEMSLSLTEMHLREFYFSLLIWKNSFLGDQLHRFSSYEDINLFNPCSNSVNLLNSFSNYVDFNSDGFVFSHHTVIDSIHLNFAEVNFSFHNMKAKMKDFRTTHKVGTDKFNIYFETLKQIDHLQGLVLDVPCNCSIDIIQPIIPNEEHTIKIHLEQMLGIETFFKKLIKMIKQGIRSNDRTRELSWYTPPHIYFVADKVEIQLTSFKDSSEPIFVIISNFKSCSSHDNEVSTHVLSTSNVDFTIGNTNSLQLADVSFDVDVPLHDLDSPFIEQTKNLGIKVGGRAYSLFISLNSLQFQELKIRLLNFFSLDRPTLANYNEDDQLLLTFQCQVSKFEIQLLPSAMTSDYIIIDGSHIELMYQFFSSLSTRLNISLNNRESEVSIRMANSKMALLKHSSNLQKLKKEKKMEIQCNLHQNDSQDVNIQLGGLLINQNEENELISGIKTIFSYFERKFYFPVNNNICKIRFIIKDCIIQYILQSHKRNLLAFVDEMSGTFQKIASCDYELIINSTVNLSHTTLLSGQNPIIEENYFLFTSRPSTLSILEHLKANNYNEVVYCSSCAFTISSDTSAVIKLDLSSLQLQLKEENLSVLKDIYHILNNLNHTSIQVFETPEMENDIEQNNSNSSSTDDDSHYTNSDIYLPSMEFAQEYVFMYENTQVSITYHNTNFEIDEDFYDTLLEESKNIELKLEKQYGPYVWTFSITIAEFNIEILQNPAIQEKYRLDFFDLKLVFLKGFVSEQYKSLEQLTCLQVRKFAIQDTNQKLRSIVSCGDQSTNQALCLTLKHQNCKYKFHASVSPIVVTLSSNHMELLKELHLKFSPFIGQSLTSYHFTEFHMEKILMILNISGMKPTGWGAFLRNVIHSGNEKVVLQEFCLKNDSISLETIITKLSSKYAENLFRCNIGPYALYGLGCAIEKIYTSTLNAYSENQELTTAFRHAYTGIFNIIHNVFVESSSSLASIFHESARRIHTSQLHQRENPTSTQEGLQQALEVLRHKLQDVQVGEEDGVTKEEILSSVVEAISKVLFGVTATFDNQRS